MLEHHAILSLSLSKLIGCCLEVRGNALPNTGDGQRYLLSVYAVARDIADKEGGLLGI